MTEKERFRLCQPTPTFDWRTSIQGAWFLFTQGPMFGLTTVVVLPLIVLPFTKSAHWGVRGVLVLVGIPLLLYAVLAGALALLEAQNTATGCF